MALFPTNARNFPLLVPAGARFTPWSALALAFLLGATLGGCEGPNTSPSAVLISPVQDASLKPGIFYVQGQVSDAESSPETLGVSFSLESLTGQLATCTGTPSADGMVGCSLTYDSLGDYTLSLYVADAEGLQGSASVAIHLVNSRPTVVIESPVEGSTSYSEKIPITFTAAVSDPDDTVLSCSWTSNITGPVGTVSVDPATGRCSFTANLSRGVHELTVTATDPLGAAHSDLISIPVKSCSDQDGDGYSQECDNDCNDGDPATYPGAIETCDSKDNNCNGAIDDVTDQDLDGVTSCTGDCDDTRPEVNPTALELCDGLDNNCNGTTDEGFDTDRDGYTDQVRCPASGTDCDDRNSSVNPGAFEKCDGVDNNCNGGVDEGTQQVYFTDADGDGFGNPSAAVAACSQPTGAVSNSQDCDDTNGTVSPLGFETCNGLDDDCDAQVDEDTTPNTYYLDEDADGYGSDITTETGCVAPDGFASAPHDCDDTRPEINPGAEELCDTLDNNCSGQVDEGVVQTFYKDGDGDGYGASSQTQSGCTVPSGYASVGGDCDDASPITHPGASEACDSKDNNCNGTVDEDIAFRVYYRDADGDGYGDTANTKSDCVKPSGYAEVAGDCNDSNAAVNPGVAEVCDSKDNNCNAQIDEGVATPYYKDFDKDGYGNPYSSTNACSMPSGYVANKLDCNDGSNACYPGATEICDGLDNDCDATIDENLTPQKTYYRDADGDGYGVTSNSTKACAAPPGWDLDSGDCNDSNVTTYPGALETCDGEDDDCDNIKDEGTECYDDDADGYTEQQGDCNDSNGTINPKAPEPSSPDGVDNNCNNKIDDTTVCWDDDSDGYLEQASATTCPGYSKGAYGSSPPQGGDCDDTRATTHPGAPELFNGRDDSCDGVVDGRIDLNSHFLILSGDLKNARAGQAVSGLGDLNGDGFAELGVGAPLRDAQSQARGAVFVVMGRAGGWTSGGLNTAGVIMEDDVPEAKAGWALSAAGDVNNDGLDDFVVGAPYRTLTLATGTLTNAGSMYLIYGSPTPPSGGQLTKITPARADGLASNVLLGYSVAGGDDVTGDGIDDVALGGPWPTGLAQGYLMVMPGKTVKYSAEIKASDLWDVAGANGDALGTALALPGDVTGDGVGDILVSGFGSTSQPKKTNPGVTYYIPGSTKINISQSSTLESVAAVAWRGDGNEELVGYSVSGAGDINGDGNADLLIGRNVQSSNTQGQAYLILGGIVPPAGSYPSAADAWFLGDDFDCPCAVSGIGDINSDTFDDFAVGVSRSDLGGTDSGAIYLFFGQPEAFAGAIDLDLADAVLYGVAGEQAGAAIAPAGDLNGDLLDDFVVGAPMADASSTATDTGRVFVFFGFEG